MGIPQCCRVPAEMEIDVVGLPLATGMEKYFTEDSHWSIAVYDF